MQQQISGDGTAVGGQGGKLKLLVKDYKKAVKVVTHLKFKGEFLDLDLEVAQSSENTRDEEKLIKKIVDERAGCSTSQLMKLGIQVASSKSTGFHKIM